MEEQENYEYQQPEIPSEKKPSSTIVSVITAQAVCVLIIIVSILVMKYFFGGYYETVKKWYNKNFCTETSVSEVLENSGGDKDEI